MKNSLTFLGLLCIVSSCEAKQVYPLNSDYEGIPNNSYIKDLNNELPPYIGTYKAHDQGNEITLFISNKKTYLLKDLVNNFIEMLW